MRSLKNEPVNLREAPRSKDEMMNLNGTWYNELGSMMQLTVDPLGSVSGLYQTKVGDASGLYKLSGRTEVNSPNNDQNIGFVVSWENDSGNSYSVTAWSGQVQLVGGEQIMRTTWLLTSETNPQDDWKSTLVGMNVFRRDPVPVPIKPTSVKPYPTSAGS